MYMCLAMTGIGVVVDMRSKIKLENGELWYRNLF